MSLTTPVLKDYDSAFPGENWFFYWKTSASLWKMKLQEFPGTKVIIPINWCFHSETGDTFDFGELKPETDILKLLNIVTECSKEAILFLPITPAPYLANGGLPHLLSRTLALNSNGMTYGIIDAEDNLIKIYSFFDPRVFEAFARFTRRLGDFFKEHRISLDLWAIRSGSFENGQFKSFINDTSKAFETAYLRFLSTKTNDISGISPVEDRQFRFEFTKSIEDLYLANLKESVGVNFEGVLDVAFIGSSTQKFLKRMHRTIAVSDYTTEIYEALAKDIIPSSILVDSKSKKSVLGRELNDLIANSYLPSRLTNTAFEYEDVTVFSPLSFFKIFEKIDGVSSLFTSWETLDLWTYLKEKFGWSYKIISRDTLSLHEIKTYYHDSVMLFHGQDVDRNIFTYILKNFMNGGKIILNQSGLSSEYSQKIEAFLLENSLKVEKVNFKTNVQNIELGDGRLVLFDGDSLGEKTREELREFWEKIISTFNLIHIQIKNADGVDYYWRTRPSTTNELKFEEVRRLSLYNPTSYRKKVKMSLNKNFVIYKVIDEINVIVQTFPNEVEVELLPEGSVILDFGVFS